MAFIVSLNKNQQEVWTGRQTDLTLEKNLATLWQPLTNHSPHFLLYKSREGDFSAGEPRSVCIRELLRALAAVHCPAHHSAV